MIVAGFGFRASATAESLASALAATGKASVIDAIATAADKIDTRPFKALTETLDLPAIPVAASRLVAARTVTHSRASLSARGTGSVAEAAALAAAGDGAMLIATRCVSEDGRATCALARGDSP